MKFLFGLDVTQGDENYNYDGKEFMVQETSKSQAEALEKAAEESVESLFSYKSPFYIRFIEIVSAIALLISSVFVMATPEDMGIVESYQKIPWAYYTLGLALVLLVAFIAIDIKMWKKSIDSEENKHLFSEVEIITKNIHNELGVPANALEVDIISPRYAYGYNDEIEFRKRRYEGGHVVEPEYENHSYKLFVSENTLFIVDTEGKYAVPLSEIKRIRTVNEKIAVDSWLKDESYDEGQYKKYKIREDDEYNISFKPYHILEIEHEGEEWEMYFPCYELPVIEKLTGLKAE